MDHAHDLHLRQACEALRAALGVGLPFTRLRLSIRQRDGSVQVIDLADDRGPSEAPDERHGWLRPEAPANIRVAIADDRGVIGELVLEDSLRAAFAPDDRQELERIVALHAGLFRTWVEEPLR